MAATDRYQARVHTRTGALVAVLLAASMVASCEGPRISSQVTAASIRKIVPGMKRTDVLAVLGQPLRERPGSGNGATLDYAIPGAALRSTIGFWIALDHDGTVYTVHVKKHPPITEDFAIYEATPDRPVYEHPDFARFFNSSP
jgi:hypothetical protein